MNKRLVAALLEERKACQARKRHDRVAAIDAELRAAGYVETAAPVEAAALEPEVETATAKKAAKRKI